VVNARSMNRLSSVIPFPCITHEYIEAVLHTMIYCVRSAVKR
jgi:hypothetical protein